MTQRRRLDAFLAAAAAEAGADLREGAKVDELTPDESGVTARVGDALIRADTCIGADGANGVVARTTGVEPEIVYGVALEGNVPLSTLAVPELERTAVIELGIVPGGYGWVFPKGDHANLGVGGWGDEGPRLRAHLDELARRHEVDPAALTEVRGHRLPMRRPGTQAHHGRVLLVGDAAGLVDPLSGDGMYEAFTSAALAAEAVLTDSIPAYTQGLAGALDRHATRLVGGKACARPTPAARVCSRTLARSVRRRRPASVRRACPPRRRGGACTRAVAADRTARRPTGRRSPP